MGRRIPYIAGVSKFRSVMGWMVLVWLAGLSGAGADGLFSKASEESYKDRVVVMRIGQDDLMKKQSFRFMARILDRVEKERAAALVIDLDTPGGVVWETTDLMMNKLVRLTVPTYAFVNSRAIVFIHASFGLVVQPAKATRRVFNSMTKSR